MAITAHEEAVSSGRSSPIQKERLSALEASLKSWRRSSGFSKRTKGSHNIFRKAGVEERVKLQRDGNHAKPYQVKQVRAVFLKYKFGSLNE